MDRQSVLRALLSPSNLWALFKWGFPAGAAALSAFLSWLWSLPPSVTLLMAFLTAGCAIIIYDAVRRSSIRGAIAVGNFSAAHFARVADANPESLLQIRVLVHNKSFEHALHYDFDVLSQVLQGRANITAEKLGSLEALAPRSSGTQVMPMIDGLRDGAVIGKIHVRVRYGHSLDKLKYADE
jgi:hypothetical protein